MRAQFWGDAEDSKRRERLEGCRLCSAAPLALRRIQVHISILCRICIRSYRERGRPKIFSLLILSVSLVYSYAKKTLSEKGRSW